MALTERLPVYRDLYRLILRLFELTKHFPREYKYTLGQDIKHDAIILVRSIYRSNHSASKKEWLEEFLDNYEILKLEVRLCVDLRLLSLSHQAELTPLIESVGKRVNIGWYLEQINKNSPSRYLGGLFMWFRRSLTTYNCQ